MKSYLTSRCIQNLSKNALDWLTVLTSTTLKIISGYYNVDASLFFKIDEGGRRGHSKKLYKRRSRPDTSKYVFANRITDL